MSIYEGNGITGVPIHTQSFNIAGGYQKIEISTPIPIEVGEQYTFELPSIMYLRVDEIGGYSGGNGFFEGSPDPYDLYFKIFMEPSEAPTWVDLH